MNQHTYNFYRILVYVDSNGLAPLLTWLELLKESEIRARIKVRIDRVRLGNFGDAKSVGSGIHELRLHFGIGYRIYFGVIAQRSIVLLCGGNKSTQRRDISKARIYWRVLNEKKEGFLKEL